MHTPTRWKKLPVDVFTHRNKSSSVGAETNGWRKLLDSTYKGERKWVSIQIRDLFTPRLSRETKPSRGSLKGISCGKVKIVGGRSVKAGEVDSTTSCNKLQ